MKLHFELDRRSIFCIKLIRTRSCFLSFNDAIHCNWNIIEIFTDLNDKSPSCRYTYPDSILPLNEHVVVCSIQPVIHQHLLLF